MIVPELNGIPKLLTKNISNLPANSTIHGIITISIPPTSKIEIKKEKTIPLKVGLYFLK